MVDVHDTRNREDDDWRASAASSASDHEVGALRPGQE